HPRHRDDARRDDGRLLHGTGTARRAQERHRRESEDGVGAARSQPDLLPRRQRCARYARDVRIRSPDHRLPRDRGFRGRGAVHHRGRPGALQGQRPDVGRRAGDHRPERFRGARRLDAARSDLRICRARRQAPGAREGPTALRAHRHAHRARAPGAGDPPREGARRRRGHRGRLAPHGGHDPPAPRPEEAAAGVRLGAQGLGPRTGRVDAQHDRLRFTRPRSPGRSAHRGARLWTRPFDLDQGVPEAGLHGDRRRRLVRGGFAHGTLDTGPRLGGDAEDQAESGHRAALARVADEQGHAPFSELAIAYREEFLTLRAHSREAGLPELGGLSVEEFRTSLRTSVLPRLALMKVVTYAAAALEDAAPIAFTVEAWEEIVADRAASADRLLGAAEHALTRADSASGEHPVVRGGSRLTATGLLKAYKGRSVVNDVSVQLDQGEIVGLLGPNGAGKTTTFYMITGLIRPDGGHIALDGRDITAEPMYRRARMGIGYLAQEPSVFRKLTVEDNVRAILETLPLGDAERRERLERLLDELAIKHLRRQKGFQLSGGERRRLEITRALVTEPKFMLLDEPFAGVDPIAVHDIQTIVAGLRHRGIGVLITDHNVEQTEVPLAEEAKEDAKEAEKNDEPDWEDILLDDGTDSSAPPRDMSEAREYVEPVPVETKDLSDHLREQVRLLDLTPRQQLLA